MVRFMGILIMITASISGCANLILRETDSTAEITGKIAARVLLVLPTFLMSEAGIAQAKAEEQRQDEARRYEEWFRHLSPEQQAREEDRQDRRQAAALQALGLALSSGGPMRSYPVPVFQPVPLPGNSMQAPRLRTTCTSQQIMNQTITSCQ
jgi:hypothetical protein